MTDRVGQVWEVGERMYLVVSVREKKDKLVTYDGLCLVAPDEKQGTLCRLAEGYEGQWERMQNQRRVV